ncbi:DUF418 domain-containing protein [Sphaerisporangium flaviroseum]|uniref:DUF418 domain-containing protein n=1 Tax=Sphaerisporangium flaviroseum TaxID=509199 RepID=A0ABP7HP47_9ACTN
MTRIRDLDALRGFAVCGIMVVNTWQHANDAVEEHTGTPIDWVVENLLQSRFYPIFSFLFGVSFVLFLRSAALRTPHPRLVTLRRLIVLAGLGALHEMVNPGEVLLPYAATGVLLLLPASYVNRWLVLLAGIGATIWAMLAHAGGVWLVPGVILLGMAAMGFAPGPRVLKPAFITSGLLAVALTGAWMYVWPPPETFDFPYTRSIYPLAGLVTATAYCTGVLLLRRWRPGTLSILEPLGRMALTCYLSGTLVILATLPLLAADDSRVSVVAVAMLTVAAQAAFSRWWLARFRYGPLEWGWRCLTWWEIVPNRHPRPALPG